MSLVEIIQEQASYIRKLTSELDSEANIDHSLSIAKAERQKLAKTIQVKRTEIALLEKNSKKEYEDARKLRHLTFRSAAATLSGKKKELLAKEEAKYQHSFENEQRSKRDLEHLQANYDTAIYTEAEFTKQKSHFEETRLQYEALLDQIFQTEDANFPSEPQLRAELRNYKEQRQLAKRDKGRFIEAEKALAAAMLDIKKIIQLLDTVVNYAPFDIFGGPIIDEEQVLYLEAAKKRIWDIQRLLNLARSVLPEIPHPQNLDVVTNNTLLSMQLGLNYVDIAWKAKTSQCFAMLATAYRNIQNSITWVKQYVEYTVKAINQLGHAIESTQISLKTERRRIINQVLDSNNFSSGSILAGESSSSAAAAPDIFEPTPMYEPPAL